MNIVMLDVKTLGDDLRFTQFEHFGTVTVYETTSETQKLQRITEADIIIVNKVKMDAATLSRASNLKLICVTATGYDNIDLSYCRAHGIGVCNVTAYSTDSVAQITLAMALSLSVHLEEYRAYVADGRYAASNVQNYLKPVYHELRGKTWGVLGLGHIGRQVAVFAETLGCHVLAYKRTPDAHFACTDIDTVCRQADILSVHLPLSEDTYHLLNEQRLAQLKTGAILVNVARGAIADEEAVVAAYERGQLGGLGIDVYSVEPIQTDSPYHRIMNKPNVILTPHMAWGAYEARVRCMNEIEKNIDDFLNGGKRNRVV